jgi:hypothetical protein
MTARAIGFSPVAKLSGMRIAMTVCTFFSDSFISLLMTTSTCNGHVLPNKRERSPGMIELNRLPYQYSVARITVLFFHKYRETSCVAIIVAGFASDVCKMKYQLRLF